LCWELGWGWVLVVSSLSSVNTPRVAEMQ
jgi:hypothetical protein